MDKYSERSVDSLGSQNVLVPAQLASLLELDL